MSESNLSSAVKGMTAKLIQVQMEEYPDSIILSLHEVYSWAGTKPQRLYWLVLALQYPCVIFYNLPRTKSGMAGFRYGYEGSEYMSGASTL